MGTLVIRVPEDVNAECKISNSESLTCRQRSFMKNIRQVKPMMIWRTMRWAAEIQAFRKLTGDYQKLTEIEIVS